MGVPASGWTRLARAALVLIVVTLAGFAATRISHPVNIDTDLKNLSPAMSDDPALQRAVDTLSGSLEGRMMLVLAADAPVDPAPAAQSVAEQLGAIQGVVTSLGDALPEDLISLFATHRFQLLNDAQRIALLEQSDADLVASATQRLYQLADSGRVLPFSDDPLGWFSDYLTSLVDADESAPSNTNENIAVVHINLGSAALDGEFQKVFSVSLDDALATVETEQPGVTVYKSGIFLFAEQAARTARADITLISTISTIAVIGLMLLAFQSLRPMLLALVSIALGIGFAFVASHLLFGKVHILTLVFGVGLIGIVIDYALHFSYHQTWGSEDSDHSGLLRAMALSLGSSLIGYGALGLSELPALGRVAVFSCLGLGASWLCVIALGPWLGKGQSTHRSRTIETVTGGFRAMANGIATKPWALVGVLGIAALGAALVGVPGNDDPRALFSPDPELIAQERAVAKRTSQFEPGQYFVVRGDTVDALYSRIAKLEGAAPDAVFSIADFLPSPAQQATNHALQEKLYTDDGVVDQFLTGLGADIAIADTLRDAYSAVADKPVTPRDFSEAAGVALPPLVLDQDGELFSFVLIRDAAAAAPAQAVSRSDSAIQFIDTAGMASRALGNQRRSALKLLLLGFGLIGLLLLLRYRRIAALGLLLVPATSMLAVLVTFAALGVGVTLFHAMALFLVLGLGMDYVIFSTELRDTGSITSQAVFLSALTSLLSFGLLAVSSMPVVQAFGLTMLVGNLFNLIGALVCAALMRRYPALAL